MTSCDGARDTVAHAGKVHLFRRAKDCWEIEAILTASPPLPASYFGTLVVLGDNELFVGASGADGRGTAGSDDATTMDNGVVYVFTRVGPSWLETQRIVPSNPIDGASFGGALSVRGDRLAVGAWLDSHPEIGVHSSTDIADAEGGGGEPIERSGAAYVFRKHDGRWEEEAYFKAFNRAADAFFGETVAVEGDFLYVGAPGESGAHATADAEEIASGAIEADPTTVFASGAVYVYQHGARGWTAEGYLKAVEPSSGSLFGISLAVHSGKAAIGAPWVSPPEDGDAGTVSRAGAAYLYGRHGRAFAPLTPFHHPRLSPALNLGYSVALSDRYAVLGAAADEVGPGSVSIFELGQ